MHISRLTTDNMKKYIYNGLDKSLLSHQKWPSLVIFEKLDHVTLLSDDFSKLPGKVVSELIMAVKLPHAYVAQEVLGSLF